MAKGDKHVVVLRDDAGQTYLLDDQTLEQSRVPTERSGEVDQVLKDSHYMLKKDMSGGNSNQLALEKVVAAYVAALPAKSQPDDRRKQQRRRKHDQDQIAVTQGDIEFLPGHRPNFCHNQPCCMRRRRKETKYTAVGLELRF